MATTLFIYISTRAYIYTYTIHTQMNKQKYAHNDTDEVDNDTDDVRIQ